MKKLTEPLPSERSRTKAGPRSTFLLSEAPIEQLDEFVARRNASQPAAETCDAMMKLIALAPRSQFLMLREVYGRHCAPACS